MEDKSYVYLVRRLELDAEENPGAFRKKVVLLGGSACAVLVLVLILLAVLGTLSLSLVLDGGNLFATIAAGLFLLGIAGLLFTVLRAFLLRLPEPEGIEITPAQAPRLFKLLERIRSKLDGPPIARVVIDGSFNAAIAQIPRFGLFGSYRNHLILGLPFLYAMSSREMTATLAHEYGHLASAHGKFSAWIYRQRVTFAALMEKVADSAEGNPLNRLLFAALARFAPYFNAYTFVLSRQDEYQADADATRLVGASANARSLCRGELLGHWFNDSFWRRLYDQTSDHPQPTFMPYSALPAAFIATYQDWAAPKRLKQAQRRRSGLHDTHPCLRDRLQAIGEKACLPPPVRLSAAEDLLGPLANALAKELDTEWWRDEAPSWQAQHRQHTENRAKIATLGARALDTLAPPELLEFAHALAGERQTEKAYVVLEHLLAREGGPFPRARLLYGGILLDAGNDAGLHQLQRAAGEDWGIVAECAERGYEFLCVQQDEEAAQAWADKLAGRA